LIPSIKKIDIKISRKNEKKKERNDEEKKKSQKPLELH